MVLCGVCKKEVEPKNRWLIEETAVDNSILRKFKVCDGCATSLVRKIVAEMNTRDGKAPDQIDLTKTGLIKSIELASDNVLEFTISMDLAKARKVVLDTTEEAK
ncbi:MAG: hypothetical protein QXO69_03145 [archaeon]